MQHGNLVKLVILTKYLAHCSHTVKPRGFEFRVENGLAVQVSQNSSVQP